MKETKMVLNRERNKKFDERIERIRHVRLYKQYFIVGEKYIMFEPKFVVYTGKIFE